MIYKVKIYDKYHHVDDKLINFTNIICIYKKKWVYVRGKNKLTWELPGGHREEGENIIDCAKRELFEETGALKYDIIHMGSREIEKINTNKKYYGYFYFAKIKELKTLPVSEIEEIGFFEKPPNKLTYGFIQQKLQKIVSNFIEETN